MNPEEEEELDFSQFYQGTDEWDEGAYDASKSFEERYQSAELIASGGMKDIYKIYDTMTCRHIALAQLREDVLEEHCESFLSEAYLTASMEHPNIISVYDVGLKKDNEPYFTMELKVGSSLTDLLDKNQVGLTGLLEIYLKICDAISYAHSCGNLHLDIKPDNVQVGTFGEVQVCDWGLGSHLSDQPSIQEGEIKGTPGFMAPEQGMPGAKVDKQTDIYSLGALLYSILTGKIPVEGGLHTIISNTVNGSLEFPVERFPGMKIPASLDAVVRKAMAHEKEERYSSVDLLKNEVNKFLTGHSTDAENAGFFKEFSLFYKRNRAITLVVFAALFLLGLGSSIFIYKLQESNRQKDNAMERLKKSIENLQISQENERRAQENERQANKKSTLTLNKYLEKKEEQKKISRDLHDEKFEKAYDLSIYPTYFFDPIKAIDKSLAILKEQYQETKKPYIAQQIIINLFISQKFAEISNYKAIQMEPLADLAKTYVDYKLSSKTGALKDMRFLKILRDLNSLPKEKSEFRYLVMERMIYYQMAVKGIKFTSGDVVIELLKSWNPDWDASQIEIDEGRQTLSVTGKNLKKVIAKAQHSAKVCFFELLKIDSLSVRGTGIEHIEQFKDLNVESLDIRDTPINRFHSYKALSNISKLIIDEDQFDKRDIRKVLEAVDIALQYSTH